MTKWEDEVNHLLPIKLGLVSLQGKIRHAENGSSSDETRSNRNDKEDSLLGGGSQVGVSVRGLEG